MKERMLLRGKGIKGVFDLVVKTRRKCLLDSMVLFLLIGGSLFF